MNIQIKENDYSEKIKEVLNDKEWRTFSRVIKFLNYNSPGEYLFLFYDDEKKFLEENKYYRQSNYVKRREKFLIKGLIDWPITDWRPPLVRKILFYRSEPLFIHLHSELNKREFLNPGISVHDLEIKIIRYKRLSNYLTLEGFGHNFYLDNLELLLEERLINDKKNLETIQNDDLITFENGALIESENVLNQFIEENPSKILPNHHTPLFHYLLDSARKLHRLSTFLKKEGVIDDRESFLCLFDRNDKRIYFKSKTIWYSEIIALIFTFKSLMVYGVLKDDRQIAIKLSKSFLDKNEKEIKNSLIHSMIGPYKFNEINKRDLQNWVKNNGNKQIEEIYKELRKIFFNDIDLL